MATVPLGPQVLRRLYASMLKCRMVELRAGERRSIGHEATPAATVLHLKRTDLLAPAPSDFAAKVAKGVSLSTLLMRRPERDRRLPLDVIPPAGSAEVQLAVATGLALAIQQSSKARIVLALFDDPAALRSQAITFASRHRLPIVFVLERAHGSSTSQATGTEFAGMPLIAVDGNDAIAVYRVAQESTRHARLGNGPTLIHALTQRRPAKARGRLEAGEANDPLSALEDHMRTWKLWSDRWKRRLLEQISSEIEGATNQVRRSRGELKGRGRRRPSAPAR